MPETLDFKAFPNTPALPPGFAVKIRYEFLKTRLTGSCPGELEKEFDAFILLIFELIIRSEVRDATLYFKALLNSPGVIPSYFLKNLVKLRSLLYPRFTASSAMDSFESNKSLLASLILSLFI
jgi:hypothetical protein